MKEKLSIFKASRYLSHDMQIAIFHVAHDPNLFDETVFKREFWKIVYFVSGEGTFRINDQYYRISPGFVCLIHPNDVTTAEIKEKITLYNILFQRELIADDLKKLYNAYHFFSVFDPKFQPDKSLNHNPLHLLDSNRNIYALIKAMNYEYLHQDANSKELLRCQLLELLINLSRLSSKSFTRHRRSEMIRTIDLYLQQHFKESLSTQRIADEFGISRGYLFNFYRKHTGKTIGGVLQEIRMAEAKRLLLQTEIPIEKLCYRCGFSDLCNFYRVFKRETNCSPGEFRKTHQTSTPPPPAEIEHQ